MSDLRVTELTFDREATLNRLFKPIPAPTKDSLIGVMDDIGKERQMMIDALTHISNTSNNYESKYAKQVLLDLNNRKY